MSAAWRNSATLQRQFNPASPLIAFRLHLTLSARATSIDVATLVWILKADSMSVGKTAEGEQDCKKASKLKS
jgi:hypothetical protein